MKEDCPQNHRYQIVKRNRNYREIVKGLQDHDVEGFNQAMGRSDFRDMKIAVNVYGEEIVGGTDEDRIAEVMANQGYTERIDNGEAKRKTKTVYKRPTRHERKYGKRSRNK